MYGSSCCSVLGLVTSKTKRTTAAPRYCVRTWAAVEEEEGKHVKRKRIKAKVIVKKSKK
jgi:hypothetical protein